MGLVSGCRALALCALAWADSSPACPATGGLESLELLHIGGLDRAFLRSLEKLEDSIRSRLGRSHLFRRSWEPANDIEVLVAAILERLRAAAPERGDVVGEYWLRQAPGAGTDCNVHFDKDEYVKRRLSRHVAPTFSTVTFLTNGSQPLVVAPVAACLPTGSCHAPDGDTEFINRTSEDWFAVIHPRAGTHVAFDGKLQHGVCGDGFLKRSKVRMTFIVNVYFGYEPENLKRWPAALGGHIRGIIQKGPLAWSRGAEERRDTLSVDAYRALRGTSITDEMFRVSMPSCDMSKPNKCIRPLLSF